MWVVVYYTTSSTHTISHLLLVAAPPVHVSFVRLSLRLSPCLMFRALHVCKAGGVRVSCLQPYRGVTGSSVADAGGGVNSSSTRDTLLLLEGIVAGLLVATCNTRDGKQSARTSWKSLMAE